ncbi:MAG: NAD(+) synthase, partial [Muribaculaceae bacterium]|nr:NAD(+) synthase [Muribaculaceae bacterium]
MNNFGYFRTAACAPVVHVANPMANALNIIKAINDNEGCDLYLFPELSITGYTCADLFNQSRLLDSADEAVAYVASHTKHVDGVIIIGAPVRVRNSLYNCAVAILHGDIIAVVPKTYIPNYNEFYEKRWFDTPFNSDAGQGTAVNDTIIEYKGVKIGVEICEDLWVPEPPSGRLAKMGADIIANLSASNEVLGKHRYLTELIKHQSARCRCGYVYASAGTGESSTDLVFAGNAIIAEDGVILVSSPRFKRGQLVAIADIDVEKLRNDRRKFNSYTGTSPLTTDFADYRDTVSSQKHLTDISTVITPQNEYRDLLRPVDKHPFVPSDKLHKDENCSEIIEIQCWGLQQRLEAIHCHKIVVGISGGLDSTLALLVAVRTFDNMGIDRKGIYAITMPGLATTNRTHNNAWQLMQLLGVTPLEIPIGAAVAQHFKDIDQNPDNHDATYE